MTPLNGENARGNLWNLLLCICISAGSGNLTIAQVASEQQVHLPHVMPDDMGVNWDVQHDGSIGDGGGDQYDGGGHLYLDGSMQFHAPPGAGSFSAARNEVTLGPMPYKGLNVSRRIAVNAKLRFCRWAEVLENPTGQKVSVQLRVYFNMGSSVQIVQPMPEERRGRKMHAAAIGDQRHMFAMAFAGRGSRLVPQMQPQQGSDIVNVTYSVDVPPRQTVVIVHVNAYRPGGPESAIQFLTETREREYLAQLPKELQRCVVNFTTGDKLIGELEILRGDFLDVVELRGGDRLMGTLRERAYRLHTFYGDVELPVDRVIGLINVGQYRPRQLLVTVEGEVFGGQLQRDALSLQLSSGQQIEVPIMDISRAGYRKRASEPDEWTFEKPMVVLRSGDRVEVGVPSDAIDVVTRYGLLRLAPRIIAGIEFQPEDGAAHQIALTDGSRFTGLVSRDGFNMKLAIQPTTQTVLFSARSMARLRLSASIEHPDATSPILSLANGDLLVGYLDGQVRLETTFDTIAVACDQIKHLAHVPGAPADVTVTLWDDSVIQGQVPGAQLVCRLRSGPTVNVPTALIHAYVNPRPQPPPVVVEMVQRLVLDLSADAWRDRDRAQEQILTIGPVAIRTLRGLRDAQPPEAQQRIDVILPQLERIDLPDATRSPPAPPAPSAPPAPAFRQEIFLD